MISRGLLLCLYSSLLLVVKGNTSVTLSLLSSLNDTAVLSDDTIRFCPNSTLSSLEFLCVAENSTELVWRNAKTEIRNFHIRSTILDMKTVNGSYTVYLDNDTVVNNVTSTFRIVTSRLLVRVLTSLGQKDTDRIECLAYSGTDYLEDTLVVSYKPPIDHPPQPAGSQLNVFVTGWESSTPTDKVNMFIMPDQKFSSMYYVSMYSISVTMLSSDNTSHITCPTSCYPNETCTCSGVLARSGVNVSISAVNCKDQEGPPLVVGIKKCQSETLGTAVSQKDTRCHTGSITSVEIPNGIVCFDGLIDGSIATYQCNEGYDLMGNNRLTCQLNGEWLGDVPSNCEPFVQGWIIALAVISGLLLILSFGLTVLWSVVYFRIALIKSQCCKMTTFIGTLIVEIVFLLSVTIMLGIIGGSAKQNTQLFLTYKDPLAITSLVFSILALIWIVLTTTLCFLWKNVSSWLTCCNTQENATSHTRIEKENELYYLNRSKCHEEQPEERIYDSISHASDITDWDESCTDSEGYIKTRSHRIQLDYEDSFDNIEDFVEPHYT